MLYKIIKISFSYNFFGYVPTFLNIFILPIITIFLTTDDYGLFGLIFSYSIIFTIISKFGLIGIYQDVFIKKPKLYKKFWSKYNAILVIWNLFLSVIFIFTLSYFLNERINNYYETYQIIIVLLISVIWFELFKSIGVRLCQLNSKHKNVIIINFITGLVGVFLNFILIYHYKLGYKGWIFSSFIVNLIQVTYYLYLQFFIYRIKIDFNLSRKFIKSTLQKSLPLIPSSFRSYIIDTSDRLILDFYNISTSNIGSYNLAYSFSNYFGQINTSSTQVISPINFKLLKEKPLDAINILRNYFFLWMSISITIGFNLSIWVKEIYLYLYKIPNISESYEIAGVIIMGMTTYPMLVYINDFGIFFKKYKLIMFITLLSAVFNIVFNLIFIPYYGIYGCTIVSFLTYLLVSVSGYLIPDFKKILKQKFRAFFWILLILVLTLIQFFMIDYSPYNKFCITILSIVFFFFYAKYTLKSLEKNEKKYSLKNIL